MLFGWSSLNIPHSSPRALDVATSNGDCAWSANWVPKDSVWVVGAHQRVSLAASHWPTLARVQRLKIHRMLTSQ